MSDKGTERGPDQIVTVDNLGGDSEKDTGIKDDRIHLIRFFTGQEILAEIIEEDDTSLRVRGPLAFAARPTQDGSNVQIAFGEFIPFAETDEVELNKAHVLVCYQPEDRLKTRYRSTFSKLILPNQELTQAATILTE